jgi:transposase-like protein
MKRRTRPNFTPEFRLECAQLVVDKGYSSDSFKLSVCNLVLACKILIISMKKALYI